MGQGAELFAQRAEAHVVRADAVARADRALYEAKQQGRNCVVVLDDSAPILRTTTNS